MKKMSKFFGLVGMLLASVSLLGTGCSNEFVETGSSDEGVSALRSVIVSDATAVNDSIAAPFGIVADTGTDNLIRVTWGCPSSPVDAWYIYLDGIKAAETSVLKQMEIEAYSGEHVIAVAAVKGSGRSEAIGLNITVKGTAAPSSSAEDPYQVNSSIPMPFGLVADTADANTIGVVWGMPSSKPEAWAIYLDGSYVDTTAVCTRFTVPVTASGIHEVGVAAVSGNGRSESAVISVSVTVSGTAGITPVPANGLISGETYRIISKCSGKSLDNDGWSTAAGTNIHQWTLGDNQSNQQWILTQCDDGNWIITNVCSNLVLDADDWGTADGTNVLQWYNLGGANQKWNISEAADGYYKVINAHSGLALDVSAASSDDGANVQTWTWNGSDAQLWSITKAAETPSVTPDTNPGNIPGGGGNLAQGIPTDTNDFSNLVERKNGMQLTYQFQNCTNGAWADDQIYIYIICMNTNNVWCYARPDGTLVPIAETSSDAWQYTLAQVKESGFQMPYASAGRIYYSYGQPLSMKGMNGGVVLPSLSNPADPNYSIYFDWLEYTVASNGFWVNTTQVDQLGFPVLINVYDNDGTVQQTGLSKTRDSIWQAFRDEMPDEFDTLVGTYRIVAPCKAGFDDRTGGAYGGYFTDYVTQTWDTWASRSATVTHPQGKFIMTGDGNNLYFKCIEAYGTIASAGETYTIHGKPTTSEVFEGYGVLASGNAMELALEAWICAALNRHVAHMEPDTYWNNAAYYYNDGPCNYFAKFWHDHSERGGLAYGFCYDDVNDQSATTYTGNARGVVVRLGF